LTDKQQQPDTSLSTPQNNPAFPSTEGSKFKPPVLDVGGTEIMPQHQPPVPVVVPSRSTTGNVWATKGSAHLIEAEKPKPPVQLVHMPRQPPQPISAPQNGKKEPSSLPPVEKTPQQLQEDLDELQLLSSPVNPAGPGAISPDTIDSGAGTGGHNLVSAITPPSHSLGEDLETMLSANGNAVSGGTNAWKSLETDVGLSSPHSTASHLAAAAVAIAPPSAPEVTQPQQQSIPTLDIGLAEPEETGVVPTNEVDHEVNVNSVPFVAEETQNAEPLVSVVAEQPSSEQPKPTSPTASSALPSGILNMGKWDVPEADDAGLDFGFGSFGHDSDQPEAINDGEEISQHQTAEPTISSLQQPSSQHQTEQITQLNPPSSALSVHAPSETLPSASAVNVSASPARPPPGLSISGMPPMPANAVLVHELENKLDLKEPPSQTKTEDVIATNNVPVSSVSQPPTSANMPTSSLSTDKTTSANPSDLSQQQPQAVSNYPEPTANPVLPGMSQYTAVYGMGMYNYNPSSLGNFVGVHTPAGPVLATGGVTGVLPQQQKLSQNNTSQQQQQLQQQQTSNQSNLPSQHHQQHQGAGLYGAPSTSVNVGVSNNEGNSGASSSEASNSATAGLPPGIAHGAIPYNPALYHGQQYYQMAGQPHGGVGYGYGYGAQYGGAVQGGFGYQQVMGQNNAYGQPYDDAQQLHSSQGSHHSSNSYQKSGHGGTGGYRGSRSHHSGHHTSHGNAHQYQNQYTPQQAYAAAQPYMAYSVDHRYQPNIDPYSMQQGNAYQSNTHTSGGGYSSQEDADQLQQLHKGGGKPRQQSTQQQNYGLQGTESSNANANNAAAGGWTNPRWVATNWQGS
jgi:hypothetical protein